MSCFLFGASITGGNASVAGSNKEIQFNDDDELGADSTFIFDKTKKVMYSSSVASTASGTVNRSGNFIISINLNSGRILTFTRSGNFISSFTDGIKTWAILRNGNNQITSWSVA